MTPTVRWTVLLAALLVGCTGDSPAANPIAGARNEEAAPGAEVERIAHAYHGLLLDADLKQIEVDVPLIASMQKSLFAVLLPAADAGVVKEIQALMAEADLRGWATEERVLADNAILGTLMDRSDGKLQERYDWRYRMVRAQAWEIIGLEEHPNVMDWILDRGLALFGIPGGGPGAEYVAACKERLVPTPPDFPNAEWTRQGELEGNFSFLGGDGVIVYTYWNREGACYALHRLGGNTLGIICQSASTGVGCFYDNVRPHTGRRVDPRRETVVIDAIQNGSTLGEDCTACHRGSNAFIIHPGSVLDVPEFNTNPAVRYTPMGGPSFVNPGPLSLPVLTDSSQGSCETCHEIPETTPLYCSILERAAQNTMPQGDAPVGWIPSNTHPYYAHVDFLRRHCTGG